MAVPNGVKLLSEHPIVRSLLAVELLYVTEHNSELGVHVDTEVVGVPSLNATLDLHGRYHIVPQHRQITVPRQLPVIKVY